MSSLGNVRKRRGKVTQLGAVTSLLGLLVLGGSAASWHSIPVAGVVSQNRFKGEEFAVAASFLEVIGLLLVLGGLLTSVAGLLGVFDARETA